MLNSILKMITKVGFNNLQCWRRKGAQQLRPVTNKTFSSFSFCHWQTGKLANWTYFSSIICLRYRYCSAVGSSLSIEHCKLFRLIIFFTEAGNISVKFTQVISLLSAGVSNDLVRGVFVDIKKSEFCQQHTTNLSFSLLPIQKRLKVQLGIGCWSPGVKERSLTSHPDQKLTAMVTSDQINPHLCILSDQTEDGLNIPVNKRHINLQGLPTAHLCRKNGSGTLAEKKTGKCGNFEEKKGEVYQNPTSFVIWPSGFWHAKFILRC